jgi:hypothetical protein
MYYDLNVPWNEESQYRIPQLIKIYRKCTEMTPQCIYTHNFFF